MGRATVVVGLNEGADVGLDRVGRGVRGDAVGYMNVFVGGYVCPSCVGCLVPQALLSGNCP